jgi:hypothetical protein
MLTKPRRSTRRLLDVRRLRVEELEVLREQRPPSAP